VLVAPAAAHAASYARTATLDVDGTRVTIDIYEPVARPIGVAIVAHGWTRSRARHRDAGRALAEAGVVAIIPDLPNYLDLWGNGTTIVALVGQLESGALGLPPVERSSLVLIGTSAGRSRDHMGGVEAAGHRGLGRARPGRPHRHRHVRRVEACRAGDRAARRCIGVQPVVERQDARELGAAPRALGQDRTARRIATSRRRPMASAR
jgi:hypothetical protein